MKNNLVNNLLETGRCENVDFLNATEEQLENVLTLLTFTKKVKVTSGKLNSTKFLLLNLETDTGKLVFRKVAPDGVTVTQEDLQ